MTPAEIRAARATLGLTQSQMAQVLGISRQASISEMETGKINASGQVARLIRAYLEGYRPADWPKDGKT